MTDEQDRRYHTRRASTGRGNLGDTIKRIVTAGAITGAGIAGASYAARAISTAEAAATGAPMAEPGEGWNR